MPRFSLIVATINRTEEFSILLKSLAEQEMRDFELIVVDQNPDDRLSPLLEEWASKVTEQADGNRDSIQVKHLHCAPGVSRARNLRPMHCTGDIVAFPDDDCWYLPDTLQKVDTWFQQNEHYGILSLGCRDERGRTSGNRWWEPECDLKSINIFKTSGTCTFFVRRPPQEIPLFFDESLGPGAGTEFGAAEDTDFLLTLMSYGIRGRFYSASMWVTHAGMVSWTRGEQRDMAAASVVSLRSIHFRSFVSDLLLSISPELRCECFLAILAGLRNYGPMVTV